MAAFAYIYDDTIHCYECTQCQFSFPEQATDHLGKQLEAIETPAALQEWEPDDRSATCIDCGAEIEADYT